MSDFPLPDHQFDDRVQEVLDGTADEPSREAVLARIETDPRARERYIRMLAVFEQLDTLEALPVPQRAFASIAAHAAGPAQPSRGARRPRYTRPMARIAARRTLLVVAAAASVAFLVFGPSSRLLRDPLRGAEGTMGLQSIPTTTRWAARDALIALGAVQHGANVRMRVRIEAEIPGTVSLALDAALWRVTDVESIGPGGGWTSPAPGSLNISVAREVDLLLTLRPTADSAGAGALDLRMRVGDEVTNQIVPIEGHHERSTNFPAPGR